ncbi:type VI secretion system protein ImpK [Thiopseudomonas alkaliphila]|uniref:type IVB secretion system protein IcmH/DotU n=1 Tax=Thiopseudomonas alkaliphila TaxID=1697053 RepID=UPI00069E3306|nr:type IVB secretion system protein IcmH/DotU [Thiopseudomonas alkaliphila]AKX44209.1 type VI secretion system protein ImpK [Thiopseudomonas alkaliphila]
MNMLYATTQNATETIKHNLTDLMFDGFYMLLLIKQGQTPKTMQPFLEAVQSFLQEFEKKALKQGFEYQDIHATKYAFCATVDETILHSDCSFKEEWGCNPLQLISFGDHLAGENFFTHLEELRAQGASRLPALEVYHFCLLLGFKGKYFIEGTEKLHYLKARLGDELIYLKGNRSAFAPHWQRPDTVSHKLRRNLPIWAATILLGVICFISYFFLSLTMRNITEQQLAAYENIIQTPSKIARVHITLP